MLLSVEYIDPQGNRRLEIHTKPDPKHSVNKMLYAQSMLHDMLAIGETRDIIRVEIRFDLAFNGVEGGEFKHVL